MERPTTPNTVVGAEEVLKPELACLVPEAVHYTGLVVVAREDLIRRPMMAKPVVFLVPMPTEAARQVEPTEQLLQLVPQAQLEPR